MSLASNLGDLATRLATECKALRTLMNNNAADLSALSTSAKSTIVAAINELQSEINALASTPSVINDAATGSASTWSSTKISTEINAEIVAALNDLVDGAPGAIDTLNELAAAIGDDANFATTVTTALGKRLRFDAAQTLTGPEQTQAQTNLNVYSKTELGSPTTDFVATFNAGLA